MNNEVEAPLVRVVLIEDEKQIRRFVRMALEAEGCQVSEPGVGYRFAPEE